jgi:hypothetical protein
MNEQFKKRLVAFLWGLGSAIAITTLSYVVDFVPTLGLPEFATLTIVLLSEQLTKYLNKR